MKKQNVIAYLVKDGDNQIIVIPEEGGIFGKEGFCELNSGILENLASRSNKGFRLSQEKIQSFRKRSEYRKKMTELFNDLADNVFDDTDGFLL